MCAALAGRAPAGWRGPGADAASKVAVADNPWFKEARVAKLGDRDEAERLGWTPMGRSERLTGAKLPRAIKGMEAVREKDRWSKVLKVGEDCLVNWRRNRCRVDRDRGV